MPRATHVGELDFDGVKVACAVLDDGRRVLGQQAVFTAIGRSGKSGDRRSSDVRSSCNLPDFLAAENLKPYVLQQNLPPSTSPIRYLTLAGRTAYGYQAGILSLTIQAYIGVAASGTATHNQRPIIAACMRLMPALVGVAGAIRRTDERGEYWSARELMPLLGYAKWQMFEKVIGRVTASIGNTGLNPADHVTGARNMVPIGKGAMREALDYRLSRHACHICAMNGDPRKPAIDFGPVKIASARLDNGTLVNNQQSLMLAIGRDSQSKGRRGSDAQLGYELPDFLAAANLKPYVPEGFQAHSINYQTLTGHRVSGYNAQSCGGMPLLRSERRREHYDF